MSETQFDPYKKLRERIQQAINSSHFDTAVTLIESLLEQTSPRKDTEGTLTSEDNAQSASAFGQFELEPLGSLSTIEKGSQSQPSLPDPPSHKTPSARSKKPVYHEAANLSFGPLHDTVLLECAGKNQPEALKRMLQLGANPARPNARGLTPLIKAAGAGNLECCKILVKAGVDLFAKDQKVSYHACTLKLHLISCQVISSPPTPDPSPDAPTTP